MFFSDFAIHLVKCWHFVVYVFSRALACSVHCFNDVFASFAIDFFRCFLLQCYKIPPLLVSNVFFRGFCLTAMNAKSEEF